MAVDVHRLHLRCDFVSRSSGAGVVATAAYNLRAALTESATGRVYDYSDDVSPAAAAIITPDNFAHSSLKSDPEALWNFVEATETALLMQRNRRDPLKAIEAVENAQTGLKGRFSLSNSIPREMLGDVVDSIMRKSVVDQLGGLVHYAVHADEGNFHVHFIIAGRKVSENGEFGARIFRQQSHLKLWTADFRATIAGEQNRLLESLRIAHHVEHYSNQALGLSLKSTIHIDHGSAALAVKAVDPEVGITGHNARVQSKNAAIIIDDPAEVVKLLLVGHRDQWGRSEGQLCRDRATVTEREIRNKVLNLTGGREDVAEIAVEKLLSDSALIALGRDARGDIRYTTAVYLDRETALIAGCNTLAESTQFAVSNATRERVISQKYGWLSDEQQAAVRHMTEPNAMALVQGRAGVGKTTLMVASREVWEAHGYQVRGAAIAWRAAKTLEREAGMVCASIAAIVNAERQQLENGRCARPDLLLQRGQVLVVDEAGMVDVHAMRILVSAAEKAGAKIVAIGDKAQFASIAAGPAFELMQGAVGAAEITKIMRQTADAEDILVAQGIGRDDAVRKVAGLSRVERRKIIADNSELAAHVNRGAGEIWRRSAAEALADGRTAEGLAEWHKRGHVHAAETADEAKAAIVEAYFSLRDSGETAQAIYAFKNSDVQELNRRVRVELQNRGELPADETGVVIGGNPYVAGDKVAFSAGDLRGAVVAGGVVNGDGGTIAEATAARVSVRLDDGRDVSFDPSEWSAIAHSYATTQYKSQGATIGGDTGGVVHVYADEHLRADGAYVALTRSKQATEIYYSRSDFADFADLARSMSRAPIELAAQDVVRASGQVAEDLLTVVKDGRAMVEILRRHDDRLAAAVREHEAKRAAGEPSQEPSPHLTPPDAAKVSDLKARRLEASARLVGHADRATVTRAARHVGLSVERLEELAGLRQPARTPRQQGMDAVARAWVEAHTRAREVWQGLRAVAAGREASHADYPRFSAARDERDKLALALREQAALGRGSVGHVADRALWRAVTRQAAGAEKRISAQIAAEALATRRRGDEGQRVADQATRKAQTALDKAMAPLLAPRVAKIGWDLSRAGEVGLAVQHTPDGVRVSDSRRPEASASIRALLDHDSRQGQGQQTAKPAGQRQGQKETQAETEKGPRQKF